MPRYQSRVPPREMTVMRSGAMPNFSVAHRTNGIQYSSSKPISPVHGPTITGRPLRATRESRSSTRCSVHSSCAWMLLLRASRASAEPCRRTPDFRSATASRVSATSAARSSRIRLSSLRSAVTWSRSSRSTASCSLDSVSRRSPRRRCSSASGASSGSSHRPARRRTRLTIELPLSGCAPSPRRAFRDRPRGAGASRACRAPVCPWPRPAAPSLFLY